MSTTDFQHPLFRRFYSHLNSAVTILQSYDGGVPFAHYIKNYFSRHKKFGSKDRKQISELCYCYFRLGRSYPQLSIEQKTVKGYMLSKPDWPDEWLAFFDSFNLPEVSPDNIFPLAGLVSPGIEPHAFVQSHLVQPDLFLRIRPGYKDIVADKLKAADIPFVVTDHSLRLHNSVGVENALDLNRDAVVQDLSSQRVGTLLEIYKTVKSEPVPSVWDCCAASGGKSILANDILGAIDLTVSDIRPSIISNLKKRFREAHIENYHAFVADTAKANPDKQFDLIIADVPCSGSGTWARTPEQLQYFEAARIEAFVKLQSAIALNAIQYLKAGGYLLYITCSVFEKENESQINLLQNAGLQLVEQRYFRGYGEKADTMFAALLKTS